MNKKQLLSLDPKEFQHVLTTEEFIHMAKTLGAFWSYDYEAADKGKVGMHAELRSGLHSDGFFASKIFLEPKNIRKIITNQMILKMKKALNFLPDAVVGIPDGATKLGEDIAKKFGVKNIKMEKIDGKILLTKPIPAEIKTLLFVEDVCTRGTGFVEAHQLIHGAYPSIKVARFNPVIFNRGGLQTVYIEGFGDFKIISLAEYKMNNWEPKQCPRCNPHLLRNPQIIHPSTPIKPKATEENWRKINTSQL